MTSLEPTWEGDMASGPVLLLALCDLGPVDELKFLIHKPNDLDYISSFQIMFHAGRPCIFWSFLRSCFGE